MATQDTYKAQCEARAEWAYKLAAAEAEILTLRNAVVLQGDNIVRLQTLLERWVNIAANGRYGDRTKHPLCVHPIVEETLQALGPPSVTPCTPRG